MGKALLGLLRSVCSSGVGGVLVGKRCGKVIWGANEGVSLWFSNVFFRTGAIV